MKNIVIQGLGFVGSATAVAIAGKLNKNDKPIFNVCGVEKDNSKSKKIVEKFKKGIFPFDSNDSNISIQTKKIIKKGNLKFSFSNDTYKTADVIIVCINCDIKKNSNKIFFDKKNFINSILDILEYISKNTLIIIQSTVPPGTCKEIVYPIIKKQLKKRKINSNSIYLAHSYERVMPGKNYLNSIVNFWRVYSGINSISSHKCELFLKKIINVSKFPLTRLSSTTASEISKILENSYRAVNIAFIEEWARFTENVGEDLFEIIEAIKIRPTHSNIMRPGFGVGGYCLTKDPYFAQISANDIFKIKNIDFPFSNLAISVNSQMPRIAFKRLKKLIGKKFKQNNILLLGASYREDISDTRNSPSEIFYKLLLQEGFRITVHDPMVKFWDEIKLTINNKLPNPYNFDVIVFAVPHQEYKKIKLKKWLNFQKKIIIHDTNNVLTKNQIKEITSIKNVKFLSTGRG